MAHFIGEADQRIFEYVRGRRISKRGFVSSDFSVVYSALEQVVAQRLAPGPMFCEWGSGFGAVTILAAMLEFQAYGIEIQEPLVEAARDLAGDFASDALFAHGSFVPSGAEALAESVEYTWWDSPAPSAYEDLELAPEHFDVIYAYPWPGEEHLVDTLFVHFASVGALLVTYHGVSGICLKRKTDAAPTLTLLEWL